MPQLTSKIDITKLIFSTDQQRRRRRVSSYAPRSRERRGARSERSSVTSRVRCRVDGRRNAPPIRVDGVVRASHVRTRARSGAGWDWEWPSTGLSVGHSRMTQRTHATSEHYRMRDFSPAMTVLQAPSRTRHCGTVPAGLNSPFRPFAAAPPWLCLSVGNGEYAQGPMHAMRAMRGRGGRTSVEGSRGTSAALADLHAATPPPCKQCGIQQAQAMLNHGVK